MRKQMKNTHTKKRTSRHTSKRQKGVFNIRFIVVGVTVLVGVSFIIFLAKNQQTGQVEGLSTPPAGKVWGQVFSDDFSGSSLNSSNWGYQTGSWAGSNVQNCYTSSSNNISVSGGTLKITALYAPGTTCSGVSRDFTSGFVQSRSKKTWTYGYFESRIKMPTNNGSMWPAFWMSPQNSTYGSWPSSGEIDVFEEKGHDPSKVYANAHWGITSSNKSQKKGTAQIDSAGNWHVYAVEWAEGSLKFFIDGVQYHSVTNFSAPNATTHPGPFNIPFYIRLNMAVGGTYLSSPYSDAHNAIANFPATMEVDYVRVYQLQNATTPPAPTPTPTPTPSPEESGSTTPSPQSSPTTSTTPTTTGSSTSGVSGGQSQQAAETTTISADTKAVTLSDEVSEKAAEIARVDYLLDGKVIQSYVEAPFDLQIKGLPAGKINIVEKITYKDGTVTQNSRTIQIASVSDKLPVQTVAVASSIGVVLLALGFIFTYRYGSPVAFIRTAVARFRR